MRTPSQFFDKVVSRGTEEGRCMFTNT